MGLNKLVLTSALRDTHMVPEAWGLMLVSSYHSHCRCPTATVPVRLELGYIPRRILSISDFSFEFLHVRWIMHSTWYLIVILRYEVPTDGTE